MMFIRILFFAIPIFFLATVLIYAVVKVKKMKKESSTINQRTTRDYKEALARNGFKSTSDYDTRRRNLQFPN